MQVEDLKASLIKSAQDKENQRKAMEKKEAEVRGLGFSSGRCSAYSCVFGAGEGVTAQDRVNWCMFTCFVNGYNTHSSSDTLPLLPSPRQRPSLPPP
jgi:hypothetical protein